MLLENCNTATATFSGQEEDGAEGALFKKCLFWCHFSIIIWKTLEKFVPLHCQIETAATLALGRKIASIKSRNCAH